MVDEVLLDNKPDNDEWGTPIELFRELDREFNFTLDPCADPVRVLKAGMSKYTKKDNGLIRSWEGESVFCNPPYSNVKDWVKKCCGEKERATNIVMLINVRTDTRWFHDFVYNKSEIRFIKGRLKFIDHKTGKSLQPSPFASMVVVFKRDNKKRWW